MCFFVVILSIDTRKVEIVIMIESLDSTKMPNFQETSQVFTGYI